LLYCVDNRFSCFYFFFSVSLILSKKKNKKIQRERESEFSECFRETSESDVRQAVARYTRESEKIKKNLLKWFWRFFFILLSLSLTLSIYILWEMVFHAQQKKTH
jgi:Mg2+/citrate symporter